MHMDAASWTSTTVMATMTVGIGLMNLIAVSYCRVIYWSEHLTCKLQWILHWLEKGCSVDRNLIVHT